MAVGRSRGSENSELGCSKGGLLGVAAQRDPPGAAATAVVLVDRVIAANGIDGGVAPRADLLGVAAPVCEPAGPARPVAGINLVVESDGIDLGVADGVGAGADLLGLQARVEPAESRRPVAEVDIVVNADGVDGVRRSGGKPRADRQECRSIAGGA
jgi:hypothetical protein